MESGLGLEMRLGLEGPDIDDGTTQSESQYAKKPKDNMI